MDKVKLSLIDIIRIAENNPNGTQLTSKIKKYVDKNGNKIKEFKILV